MRECTHHPSPIPYLVSPSVGRQARHKSSPMQHSTLRRKSAEGFNSPSRPNPTQPYNRVDMLKIRNSSSRHRMLVSTSPNQKHTSDTRTVTRHRDRYTMATCVEKPSSHYGGRDERINANPDRACQTKKRSGIDCAGSNPERKHGVKSSEQRDERTTQERIPGPSDELQPRLEDIDHRLVRSLPLLDADPPFLKGTRASS